MKKIILLLATAFLITISTFAQGEWCGTDKATEDYFSSHPEEKAQFEYLQRNLNEIAAQKRKGANNQKAPTITVPVVVHVMHYNGDGNISKAQILDGIDVLNEDFQRLNSDTSNTRAVFSGIAADAQIEFKLAQIAPDSSCTNGINRINTFETYNTWNDVKFVPGAYWNARNYFNIWLVKSISTPGVLGFAQFPGSPNLSTYGFVQLSNYWGRIGTSTNNLKGRVATHEMGHNFDLYHTFQGNCGSNCNNSGDFICDTPPAFQRSGCTTSLNTCSNDATGGTTSNPNPYTTNVVDQIENFESYNLGCHNMFTEGQKDRMRNAFVVYSKLVNLVSVANLRATGVAPGDTVTVCPPVADIIDRSPKFVCQGATITFSDDSYGDKATSWNWSFPGGTPATSIDSMPNIRYDSAGVFNVTLRVSNAQGADTLSISNLVYVNDSLTSNNGFQYVEDFESTTTIGTNWTVLNPTGTPKWQRRSSGSFFGGRASVFIDNTINNTAGELDYLISPSIDVTKVINPKIKFKVAYKQKTLTDTDRLNVSVSTDCGQSWRTRLVASSGTMSTGLQSTWFVPSVASDWKDFTLILTNAMKQSDKLKVRFEFVSGEGNNIYIDEFMVDGASSVVGINEFSEIQTGVNIYPNPSSGGITTLEVNSWENVSIANIYLTNILGKRVKEVYSGSFSKGENRFEINSSGLGAGIYFLTIEQNGERITKKLILN